MGNNQAEKHYTLTINIAEKGTTLLEDGGTSSVGHMWYAISDGDKINSYGFAPATHGKSSGPGQIYENDSDNYATRYYSASVIINEEQYKTLSEFGKMKNFGTGKQFEFSTEYRGLKNSCIDYTWKALHEVGINPKDLEGQMWPTHNADDVDKILYEYTHSDTKNWNESLPDAGGYNATYGTKNDDTLSNGDLDGHLFGGKGYDTYKVNNHDVIYDSDNQGKVYFDATLLSGIKHKVSEGVYEDKMFTYTKEANNLHIAQKEDPSKSVTIEHWNSKTNQALGIELSDERVEENNFDSSRTSILPSDIATPNQNIEAFAQTQRSSESTRELTPENHYSAYDNTLPDSVNDYLSQFGSQGNVNENDMGMDIG